MSYVEDDHKRAFSLSRWADVYLAGYTLVQLCLNLHSQGGAATIIGKQLASLAACLDPFRLRPRDAGTDNQPALSIFLWQNGASFETTMNEYTSAEFPAGIDPRRPAILKAFNNSGNTVNRTLPERIDLGPLDIFDTS